MDDKEIKRIMEKSFPSYVWDEKIVNKRLEAIITNSLEKTLPFPRDFMNSDRSYQILSEHTLEYMSEVRVLEAMRQYAKECVKASLEKALKNATDKQSILNEDNIVLL